MQTVNLNIQGAKTNPNPLNLPDGTLKRADNIVIDAPNIATGRRGFKRYGNVLGKIDSFFNYQNTILAHHGTVLSKDNGSGVWSNYSGDFESPDEEIRIKGIVANKNFYLTTSEGIRKLDSLSGSVVNAGMVKAINLEGSISGSGFLLNNNSVAYRVLWGIKDANGNVILGSPSQRVEFSNSSGTSKLVNLTIYIPQGIGTANFLQIYRSKLSGSSSVVASDEMFLNFETNPTTGDLINGFVLYTDESPDSILGATLYTSPSQEGILQGNDIPPLCKDFCLYKNSIYYANTRQPHIAFLNIIGVGAPNGIQNGDTLTINGVVFTAASSENVAAGQFKVFSTGNPANDITNTALSFVKVVNGYSLNTEVYAYYISGFNDFPGKLYIQKRDFSTPSFSISASAHASAYSPVLSTPLVSTAEVKPNRIYVSKTSEPEAVPLLNFYDLPSSDDVINRIIALRDSIFIFTESGKLYKTAGENFDNIVTRLFDSNVTLYGPETASVLNNTIFCYTAQGILSVEESGSNLVSWDNDFLFQQFSSTVIFPNFKTQAFGIGYDNDRKYLIYNGDSIYCYNTFTKGWSKWTLNFTGGFVNPTDNRLYFGGTNFLAYQERKDFIDTDFADDALPVTITGVAGKVLTLDPASMANVTVGWSISQGNNNFSLILSVDTMANTVTVRNTLAFMNGAALINEPIECLVEFNPTTAGNAGVKKQFTEATIFFRDLTAEEIDIIFSSNFDQGAETVALNPVSQTFAYATFPYAEVPYAGVITESYGLRTYVPLEKQVALWENVRVKTNQAFTRFSFIGISLQFVMLDSGFK